MNMLKMKKVVMSMVLILGLFCCGGITMISDAAGAAKNGTYCKIASAYVTDGASTRQYYAKGTNITSTTRMMTVTLQAYKADGSLYDRNSITLNTDAGAYRERYLYNVPNTYDVYAQTIIYSGTSVSTSQLESLRIQVD